MKPEDLTAKIKSSEVTSESKELLKLNAAMFSTPQLKRETKIKNVDRKVVDLDNKNKALQNEINDVKQTSEHPKNIITHPTLRY